MRGGPERKRTRARELAGLIARIGLTLGVFAYLFSRVDVAEVAASLARIPVRAAVGSACAFAAAVATGVLRWRALLETYGATTVPRWPFLARWYLVSMFYNLLPGAVGGDVLRGVATRGCFEDRSITRSVSVVFVERVLGLSGLFLLSAAATTGSTAFDPRVLLYTVLGLIAACAAIAGIAVGRRIAGVLPGKLASIARSLPAIERPAPFMRAIFISVLSHIAVSLAGHALIHSLSPKVTLAQSMVIFPLGALASYFPLTIAGAGARDAALVLLFAQIGVSRTDALATSLFLLVCHLVTSALGGVLQGREPLLGVAASPRNEGNEP